mmetsp:Transcript_3528/g.8451  ORF Transcript_3528/g.8451 Transcript_3528/m.8451 type:complete len:81 (+) Transcript_3528:29-271(+)
MYLYHRKCERRPPVNVIYLVDTGASHTDIAPRAIDAMLGSEMEAGEEFSMKRYQPPRAEIFHRKWFTSFDRLPFQNVFHR